MHTQEWIHFHAGVTIIVRHRLYLLSECLELLLSNKFENIEEDLQLSEAIVADRIDVTKGQLAERCLIAPISIKGRRYLVEAIIGRSKKNIKNHCHIFLNGELVGGDVNVEFGPSAFQIWQKIRKEGFGRYMIKGIPCSLIASVFVIIFVKIFDVYSDLVDFSSYKLFFYFVMMFFLSLSFRRISWESLDSMVRPRTEIINSPPKIAI